MDYRVIKFKNVKEEYIQFLYERELSKKNNSKNEFEPSYQKLEELYKNIGFELETVIVYFFPYYKNIKSEESNISIHAMSKDYHYISKNLLEKLKKEIIEEGFNAYIQCDNGFLNERFFAINSGLCMKGLNGLAIHEKFGSYGFLGLIATDKKMKEYVTEIKECIKCGLCIKKCPSGAITKTGINANVCVSYLTQKKELTLSEENIIRQTKKVFGCDICQEVCPHNREIKNTQIEDFSEDLLYNIKLEDISSLSNKEFKKLYGNRNFSWRGKKIIIRNLELQNEQTNDDS